MMKKFDEHYINDHTTLYGYFDETDDTLTIYAIIKYGEYFINYKSWPRKKFGYFDETMLDIPDNRLVKIANKLANMTDTILSINMQTMINKGMLIYL